VLKAAISACSLKFTGMEAVGGETGFVDSLFINPSSSVIFAAFFSFSFNITETPEVIISLICAIFLLQLLFRIQLLSVRYERVSHRLLLCNILK
jgi:hypothetical protein